MNVITYLIPILEHAKHTFFDGIHSFLGWSKIKAAMGTLDVRTSFFTFQNVFASNPIFDGLLIPLIEFELHSSKMDRFTHEKVIFGCTQQHEKRLALEDLSKAGLFSHFRAHTK